MLAAELMKGPGITSVTSGPVPFRFQGSRAQYSRSPGLDGLQMMAETLRVGYDYFSVMDIPIVVGRVFSRDRADRTSETAEERSAAARPTLVLDRDAVLALGWSDPADAVGESIYIAGVPNSPPYEIVGVVESVPLAVRDRGSAGAVYVLNTTFPSWTIVRIANADIDSSLAHIDRVFKSLEPGRPPRYRQFIDQAFASAYWAFSMIEYVFATLSVIAIAIAGCGLFGLASYMTGRRTREIGLRKSQGASSSQILRLLLAQFSAPVLIANVVVWPIALIAAERYLEVFTERTALTPMPFVVALLATLGLAWIAVGGRVVRAACTRPVDALREDCPSPALLGSRRRRSSGRGG